VRPGYYAQCTVSLITIIEMEANRHHVVKNRRRRLHEQFALFLRPPVILRALNALRDGYAEILMERYEPVIHGRFGEQSTLNGSGVNRKNSSESPIAGETLRKSVTPRKVDQTSGAGPRNDVVISKSCNLV
jgi:hypothetical protein